MGDNDHLGKLHINYLLDVCIKVAGYDGQFSSGSI